MAMTIRERHKGGATILDLKGPLSVGEGEEIFRDTIARLVKEGRTVILLNFEKVEFIDSSGIGALVKCLTSVVCTGGKIKGLRPNERVQKILKIVGVHALFEFFDDEARALASF